MKVAAVVSVFLATLAAAQPIEKPSLNVRACFIKDGKTYCDTKEKCEWSVVDGKKVKTCVLSGDPQPVKRATEGDDVAVEKRGACYVKDGKSYCDDTPHCQWYESDGERFWGCD